METYLQATDLPDDWDNSTQDNPYLKKEFLIFLDQVDQSDKSYHLFRNKQGDIDSQFIRHRRTGYNLTMFTRFKSSLKMNFIYMPVSVARPGLILGSETAKEALSYIKSIKGWKMILNLPENTYLPDFSKGPTCPRCVLTLKWSSFEHYLASMRSAYRRRYLQAFKKSAPLNIYFLPDNKDFSFELYQLYEKVYERSPYKLEKLTWDFFKSERFKVIVLEKDQQPYGFVQFLANGTELIFEFVGFNHEQNHEYDIYIRLLLEIVRYGLKNGFKTIDFGQTADEAKLKLGARYETLYAFLHHHNPIINYLAKRTSPYLGYKALDDSQFHVFKKSDDNISGVN